MRSWIANLNLHLHTFCLTLIDFLIPPMYDVINIDLWKFKMSAYIKSLGLHVYLTTTKKSYTGNDKHIEANAQALDALKDTLNKEYLYMISHCDSVFVLWNTLTSPKLQMTNNVEKESSGEESD